MKVLVNDVKGEIEEMHIIYTLYDFVELCLNKNLTLIEVKDVNRINRLDEDIKLYENKRFKGCDMILSEHNSYIE